MIEIKEMELDPAWSLQMKVDEIEDYINNGNAVKLLIGDDEVSKGMALGFGQLISDELAGQARFKFTKHYIMCEPLRHHK